MCIACYTPNIIILVLCTQYTYTSIYISKFHITCDILNPETPTHPKLIFFDRTFFFVVCVCGSRHFLSAEVKTIISWALTDTSIVKHWGIYFYFFKRHNSTHLLYRWKKENVLKQKNIVQCIKKIAKENKTKMKTVEILLIIFWCCLLFFKLYDTLGV